MEKSAPITIIGAGVFGLSTALHLAQRGYNNITIFDKQPYDVSLYSYFKGCDAASADLNKIFRSAYGDQTEYQDLSLEGFSGWKDWNAEIAAGNTPKGINNSDLVFYNNGNLQLTDQNELPSFELATVRNMEKAGFPNSQLITYDAKHVQIAKEKGFGFAIDPFSRKKRGQSYLGVLDITGGTIMADKACLYALHKAKQLGVKTILGGEAGTFESFIISPVNATEVIGIRTKDGKSHHSQKVIIACGGWTPSMIPSLDSVCETTAGSVVIMKLPPHLREKYSAQNFPSWTYKVRDGAEGGLYGFPATEEGYMKIGYRGTKYTNPKTQSDGKERSVPITRYTKNEQITNQIPTQALKVMKKFIADFLPEFLAEGVNIDMTRLCWYNDSWDNHFVIDHVPNHRNVLVATAGSGHAFKYLPNIGKWIADVLEGKDLERDLIQKWKWRGRPQGKVGNELMQGSSGPRALSNTKLSNLHQLKLGAEARL